MRTRWLGLLGAVFALGAACAEAGGKATGGELTEAGAQANVPPVFLLVPDASATCGDGGTAWTDLYRDIFGSGEPGSCTSQNICHGDPSYSGAQFSTGIHCFDEPGCRQSLLDLDLVVPYRIDKSRLLEPQAAGPAVLRTPSNLAGDMPQEPATFIMPASCVDRISDWIDSGALP